MSNTDINTILKTQTKTSQIGLIITSICFQILILLGYIRSIVLKDKELTFFIIPLLFTAIVMESVSFGLQKNSLSKKSDFIIYIIITVLLSIVLFLHFFYRKLLRYKNRIHSWSLFFIVSSILFSILLLI